MKLGALMTKIDRLAQIMALIGAIWGIGLSIIFLQRLDAIPFLLLLLLVHTTVIVGALWRKIKPSWRAAMWLGIGGLDCFFVYLGRFSIGVFLIPAAGLILLAGVFAIISAFPHPRNKPDSHSNLESSQVEARKYPVDPRLRDLTPRELEVLLLIANGKCNKEIAEALVISPNTVRHHVHQLLRKLNCSSRGEAAVMAKTAVLQSSNRVGED